MPKTIDIPEIIKNNPAIDENTFYEEQEKIKRANIKSEGYNLLSPFSSKPSIKVLDGIEKDIRFAKY